MMKLNPTGWKRKRRDTLQTDDSARAKKSRKEYNINHLINRLLAVSYRSDIFLDSLEKDWMSKIKPNHAMFYH
jgi:hypothetical protein